MLGDELSSGVKFLERSRGLPAAKDREFEFAHFVSQKLQDLRLLNIQDLALSAHEDIGEQLYFLEVKLGREAQTSEMGLHAMSESLQ